MEQYSKQNHAGKVNSSKIKDEFTSEITITQDFIDILRTRKIIYSTNQINNHLNI